MRKRLSFLIALAISLNVYTTSFAADVSANKDVKNPVVVNNSDISNLTLDQAVSQLENRNEELKFIDSKIDALNKQCYRADQDSLLIEGSHKSKVNYPNGQYAGVMIKKDVTPLQAKQDINDAKNSKDERLNSIKFDLEKQYMNVITAKAKIDNINKNIKDVDEEIRQTKAKIDVGQVTFDALNPLMVKRSQLLSQISTPSMQMQQALLNVKKYLNIETTKDITLAEAKRDYVKFDDSDIENKINNAVNADYSLNSLAKNIELQNKRVDIQTEHAFNSLTEPQNSSLTLRDLKDKSEDTSTNLQVYLWKAYYDLKNKEDAVQAQLAASESTQSSYNKAKQSFDNGVIDKVTLDSAELELNNQKVSVQEAINDYMVTLEQFQYNLDGHAALAASVK